MTHETYWDRTKRKKEQPEMKGKAASLQVLIAEFALLNLLEQGNSPDRLQVGASRLAVPRLNSLQESLHFTYQIQTH